MRHWLIALLLLAAAPAAADQIDLFTPSEVTYGTEVTLFGNFATLAAAGKAPRVVCTSVDFPKGVAFRVISVSSTEIHVLATKFPKSKTVPVAGATCDLMVLPPKDAGDPLLAADPLTIVGPELIDIGADSGEPGETLQLLVDNVGTGKLTVLFGTKKAKQAEPPVALAPLTAAPAVVGTPYFVLVPKLPSGIYPIWLQNGIGVSPNPIFYNVVVLPNPGNCPSLTATLSGKPDYDSDAFYLTGPSGGVHSCDGNSTCVRSIDAVFDPTVALNNPGQSWVAFDAAINYFEAQGGIPPDPDLQWAGTAQVSFSADSPTGPIRGSFSAVLQAVNPNIAANVNISAVFCAEQNPVVP